MEIFPHHKEHSFQSNRIFSHLRKMFKADDEFVDHAKSSNDIWRWTPDDLGNLAESKERREQEIVAVPNQPVTMDLLLHAMNSFSGFHDKIFGALETCCMM